MPSKVIIVYVDNLVQNNNNLTPIFTWYSWQTSSAIVQAVVRAMTAIMMRRLGWHAAYWVTAVIRGAGAATWHGPSTSTWYMPHSHHAWSKFFVKNVVHIMFLGISHILLRPSPTKCSEGIKF